MFGGMIRQRRTSGKEAELKVLVVCMGNICRSPTAHGVLDTKLLQAGLAERVAVDSAGTHAYHAGEKADRRAQMSATKRGYDLKRYRSRKVENADFFDFDYILAMDADNLRRLHEREDRLRETEDEYPLRAQVGLFLQYADDVDTQDVPDPYYGGPSGFEHVLDLVEAGAIGLVKQLRADLNGDNRR